VVKTTTRAGQQKVLNDLHELIEAIDRRVPHLEREGEHRIAQEAAALRQKAEERIAEIQASLNAESTGAR